MLKKYLQALLEAFLGSKKEWSSDQSTQSANTHLIDVPVSASATTWIPPKNGRIYVRVLGENDAVEIRESTTGSGTLGNSSYTGISFRCTKGVAISVLIRAKVGVEIIEHSVTFVPDRGAV